MVLASSEKLVNIPAIDMPGRQQILHIFQQVLILMLVGKAVHVLRQ